MWQMQPTEFVVFEKSNLYFLHLNLLSDLNLDNMWQMCIHEHNRIQRTLNTNGFICIQKVCDLS